MSNSYNFDTIYKCRKIITLTYKNKFKGES